MQSSINLQLKGDGGSGNGTAKEGRGGFRVCDHRDSHSPQGVKQHIACRQGASVGLYSWRKMDKLRATRKSTDWKLRQAELLSSSAIELR